MTTPANRPSRGGVYAALLKGILTRKAPLYVQFSVTGRCNMACRMCGYSVEPPGGSGLPLPEIDRLAGILKDMGVGFLVLTGGEPLMRRDLPEIVRIFSGKGISPRLQTNALLATGETVDRLADAGLEEVTVSLDTLDPETQDRITGVPGSFPRILHGLHRFAKRLPGRGNLSGINTVVSRLNILDLPAMARFATEIGFLVSFVPLHHAERGAGYSLRGEASGLRLREADFGSIDLAYAELLSLKRAGALIFNSRRFLLDSVEYLKSGHASWRCDSPDLYFSVGADGSFRPCVDRPGVASMLEGDFQRDYPEHRARARAVATDCPGCMYACYPEISRLCRSPVEILERLRQGTRLARLRRPVPATAAEYLETAHRLEKAYRMA